MIREWATVVSWQDGIATLRCEQKKGCAGCQAQASCGMRILSEIKPEQVIEFKVEIEQELVAGQRVELGIPEANLLYSAALVYLVPLLAGFIGAILCYWLTTDNLFTIIGSLLGGVGGFLIAKHYALFLEKKSVCKPSVLQISLSSEIY